MLEQRKTSRFTFEKALEATIMSIDGTWARKCFVEDVSDAGAKLTLDGGTFQGANDEFFLVLTKVGTVYRRCQRRWIHGEQMGVLFLKPGKNGKLVARAKGDHDEAQEKSKPAKRSAWLI